MTKKPMKWIRLGCENCDREDYDGITLAHLTRLDSTWQDISEVQSWEDATRVWSEDEIRCRPYERTNLEWWTHQGWCPECIETMKEKRVTSQQSLFGGPGDE